MDLSASFKYEERIDQLEEYIHQNIPLTAVNFLGNSIELNRKLITYLAPKLSENIDYRNKELGKAIYELIQLSKSIAQNFNIKPWLSFDFLNSTESQLLASIAFAQQLRVLILLPEFAKYEATKILSEPERKDMGIDSVYDLKRDIVSFDFEKLLKINSSGFFDADETISDPEAVLSMKTVMTIADSSLIMGKSIEYDFRTNSKHIFFAVLNGKLSGELCLLAAEIINKIYTNQMYIGLEQSDNLELLKNQLQSKFKTIAIEYLNSRVSKTDDLGIGQKIHAALIYRLANEPNLTPELKQSISFEILRLTLKYTTNWFCFPKNFYQIVFRDAKPKEITSFEITHVMDVYFLDNNNKPKTDFYATYAIQFSDEIRNRINFVASKGFENPEIVQKVIEDYNHPGFIDKIKARLVRSIYISSNLVNQNG